MKLQRENESHNPDKNLDYNKKHKCYNILKRSVNAIKRLTCLLFTVSVVVSLVFLLTIQVSAHPLDYHDWTWKSITKNLRIQLYPSANIYSINLSQVAFDWNYISSNIYMPSVTASSSDLELPIEIHGQYISGDTLGYTRIFSIDSSGNYNPESTPVYSGQVAKVKIYLDTDYEGPLRYCGPAEREKVITHELGHALALAHPECGAYELMQQGFDNYAALNIQSHDISCLKAKWGN